MANAGPMGSAKFRVAITGSSGYLGERLVAQLGADAQCEFLLGMDVRRREFPVPCDAEFLRFDLAAPWELLAEFWSRRRINAAVHLAWQSNPLHDRRRQREVDIQGSLNFLRAAAAAGLKRIVHCGSTTVYLSPANTAEGPWRREETAATGTSEYLYSYHHAEIDRVVQSFQGEHPEMQVVLLRAASILGHHAPNMCTRLLYWPWRWFPWVFQVRGADPPLQLLSDADMTAILIRALKIEASGIFNCAGDGTLRYTEMIRAAGKRPWPIPASILYTFLNFLWKVRLSAFPAGIVDLMRYPSMADTARLKTRFGYAPQHSTQQALEMFLKARC